MINADMILEGGGLRGVFTSGVLDFLQEQEFYTSNVIGVSAGSCNALDYVSRQIGRTKRCIIPENEKEEYFGNLKKFVKEKSLFDMEKLFDTYPKKVYPFDFDTFFNSKMQCEIVTTNCITGKTEYMTERADKDRLLKLSRASSSLPFIAPIVNIDGIPYLDGGFTDAVPIRRALTYGNEKHVIILTRNPGYRKKAMSVAAAKILKSAYKKYPNFVYATRRRVHMYNQTMEEIEQLEKDGKVFVIRPQVKTPGKLTKDASTLNAFYEHGYQYMEKQYHNLKEYMEG